MSGSVGLGAVSIGPIVGPISFNPSTQAFSFGMPRQMGGVIPDCAISESHNDRVIVTKHPVEKGASISDHAYAEPAQVHLRWGWTESLRGEAWSTIMYETLLNMMRERMPIDLNTGKRRYTNMVIESITENTDSWTEYCLIVEITLTNVIIVTTKASSIPADAQAKPEQTIAPTDAGHVSPGFSDGPGIESIGTGANGFAN